MLIRPFKVIYMKKNSLCLTLITFVLLTGCVATPDNVKNDIEEREKIKSEKAITDKTESKDTTDTDETQKSLTLLSVSDIVKNTPKTWSSQQGNLTFEGNVQVPEVETLHKYKIAISAKGYENPEKVKEAVKKYFDNLEGREEIVLDSPGTPSFSDDIEYYDVEDVEEGGKTDAFMVDERGRFGIGMRTDYWKDPAEAEKWQLLPVNANLPYHKNYYFDSKGQCIGDAEDQFTLYDGRQISIQQAMDTLMTVMSDYQSVADDIHLLPDRVSVFENTEQNCQILSSHAVLTYDGVKVDDTHLFSQSIRDFNGICRLYTRAEQIDFGFGKYPNWTQFYGAYLPDETLETYNKILSFEDAWKILEEKSAKNINVNIDRADLMYSIWYKPEKDTDEEWFMQMSEPPEMYASPVWRFLSYQNGMKSLVYYVDAVTGEVSAYENAECN